MTTEQFAALVREMRAEQRNYFKYRMPDHLQNSKKLEAQVDAAVNEILGNDDGRDAMLRASTEHPKLF